MSFATTSVYMKIAVISMALALLMFVLGFATYHWMSYSYDSLGLWEREVHDRTHDITSDFLKHNRFTDWYRATQVFECFGLICLCVAFIFSLLYMCMDRMKKRCPLLTFVLFCFAAVVCMVIGFAIFIAKLKEKHSYDVGWSMGLAMAGCALTALANLMGLIELCR